MKILICDDDRDYTEYLRDILEKIFLKEKMEAEFTLCSASFQHIEEEFYDVAYLDIDMPVVNGFELSKKLKEKNRSLYVIFVTNKDNLVFNAFDFHPYDFICKSVLERVIDYKTTVLISEMKKQTYHIEYNGLIKDISYKDIVYFDKDRNDLMIHTTDNVYRERKNIGDILFLSDEFVKIQKSIMINMSWIERIEEGKVYTRNNESFDVSFSLKKQFMNAYKAFEDKKK